jgi:hypothetical protein
LVTPDNDVTLDPQRLVWRRYPTHVSGRKLHVRVVGGEVNAICARGQAA